ncbi:hypothetical protein V8G54_033899 [Vigna mungo]|uniref:Uncharacterized protein n=1 Tax=Vigna mungo TaxID=3915 RepID=A0AAQ3RI11_VIGMU
MTHLPPTYVLSDSSTKYIPISYMASRKSLITDFVLVLTFSSMSMKSLAAHNHLQTTTPNFPSIPSLPPLPSLPTLSQTTLPPLPSLPQLNLPPINSLPSNHALHPIPLSLKYLLTYILYLKGTALHDLGNSPAGIVFPHPSFALFGLSHQYLPHL